MHKGIHITMFMIKHTRTLVTGAMLLLTLVILSSCGFPGIVSTAAQLPTVRNTATTTSQLPPVRFPQDEAAHTDFDAGIALAPKIGEGWVNGGFFVLEPKVAAYIDTDRTFFEREPLERLAKQGQLAAYKHEGFWQCMDTLRDLRLLEGLWDCGKAPWKTWQD